MTSHCNISSTIPPHVSDNDDNNDDVKENDNDEEEADMSKFIQKARRSALEMMASWVRSVLREASAHALRKTLQHRMTTLRNDDSNTNVNVNVNDVQTEDVEGAYEVAKRIGSRWKDTLMRAKETDVAAVVEVVLRTGRFLELEVVEDWGRFELDFDILERWRHNVNDDDKNDDDNNDDDVEDDMDENASDTVSGTAGDTENGSNLKCDTNTTTHDQNATGQTNDNTSESTSSTIHQTSFPYALLSKLGCHDPANLLHNTYSNSLAPSSTRWHPLPPRFSPSSPSNNKDETETPTPTNPNHIPQATLLPLHQIRRQPPKQLYGYPAPYLLHPSTLSADTFLQQQIQHIDQLCTTHDEYTDNPPPSMMWYHGWDVIQRAVERSVHRLQVATKIASSKHKYNQRHNDVDDDGLLYSNDADRHDSDGEQSVECLPHLHTLTTGNDNNNSESDNNNDNVDNDDTPPRKRAHNNNDSALSLSVDDSNQDSIRLVSKRRRIAYLLQKRRKELYESSSSIQFHNKPSSRRSNQKHRHHHHNNDEIIHGRPASAIGDSKWYWDQDILTAIPPSQQTFLEENMIHGPMHLEREKEEGYHLVKGALKYLGNLHLWEQVRANEWAWPMDDPPLLPFHNGVDGDDDDYNTKGDDENDLDEEAAVERDRKRRSAHRKAKKERLGNRVDFKDDQKGDQQSKTSSKVVWAHSAPSSKSKNRNDSMHQDNVGQNWVELDIGECTMTVILPSSFHVQDPTNHNDETVNNETTDDETAAASKLKTMLAFRSLEISLIDDARP